MDPPKPWAWLENEEKIGFAVKTSDFETAVKILDEIAEVAVRLDHHPDLHIEDWNTLRVESHSHLFGQVTDKDMQFAEAVRDLLKGKV